MAIPANTLVFSNYGELLILRHALYTTGTPPRNWKMRLYKNNYTPDGTETAASLTTANFTGYNPAAVGPWTNPATVANIATSSAPEVVFACGSSAITPNDIYGWYLTDDDGADALIATCRIAGGPVVMYLPFQELRITPTITGRTLGS